MTTTDGNTSGGGGADLLERLQAFIGRNDGRTREAFVDPTVIKLLLEAVGDRNPIYSDPAAAAKTSHGEVVAPATMLMSWTVQARPHGHDGADGAGGHV